MQQEKPINEIVQEMRQEDGAGESYEEGTTHVGDM